MRVRTIIEMRPPAGIPHTSGDARYQWREYYLSSGPDTECIPSQKNIELIDKKVSNIIR